jgi:hypothetical protein
MPAIMHPSQQTELGFGVLRVAFNLMRLHEETGVIRSVFRHQDGTDADQTCQ